MSSLAKRYARAALSSAGEEGSHAGIEAMAQSIQEFTLNYLTSQELRELLNNPQLGQERSAVLDDVFQKLGMTPQAVNLVKLLSESERIALLPEIARHIEALADADSGRLRAEVRAATTLSEQQMKRIEKALSRRYNAEVLVSLKVEPSLLGGLVCQVGDDVWDSSVKRQLDALHEHF